MNLKLSDKGSGVNATIFTPEMQWSRSIKWKRIRTLKVQVSQNVFRILLTLVFALTYLVYTVYTYSTSHHRLTMERCVLYGYVCLV